MEHSILIFAAGLLAGAMNAVGGGGSFVTLPALIYAGVPSVAANASSTVALFPGGITSVWVYRGDFKAFEGVTLKTMLCVSMTGGLVGALLLLFTPTTTFSEILPWLMLVGALTFAFGRQVGAALQRIVSISSRTLLCCQFILSIYGGYFGGAVGIMMMAVWSLLGHSDIKAMNPAKTLFVAAANSIAVICFISAGVIWWPQTAVMLVAAVMGGYSGASIARRLQPKQIRTIIITLTFLMTIHLFLKSAH